MVGVCIPVGVFGNDVTTGKVGKSASQNAKCNATLRYMTNGETNADLSFFFAIVPLIVASSRGISKIT